MRILFANATHDWGGEKSWALETAVCLQGRGHSCVMAGRQGDRWVSECREAGLDSHALRFGPAIFNPLGIYNLGRLARRHRPDCILVNISRDMCAGVAVGTMLGVPVIRHMGLAGDLNHDPVDWLLHRYCLAGSIAVGHQMKRELLDDAPWIRPDRVEVIHIGKDTRIFRPGPGGQLRRDWDLPDDALIVGITSRLEKHKGHTILLDAITRVKDERLVVVIVGGGSCQDELIRRAAELGLRERVRFLGFSRAIPDVLRCFDIFALPSLSEGFPNTLVEAMATGLPCVATNLACIPEIVEHGRHGLLVKPGDPEALASALRALVADPPLRRALGAAARARVEESFGLDVTTDRFASYVDSIRELAGRRCASTSGS